MEQETPLSEFDLSAGALCLNFINTLNYDSAAEGREELLPDYESLMVWCGLVGIVDSATASALTRNASARPQDRVRALNRAHELREMLYRLFLRYVERRGFEPSHLEAVNRSLSRALPFLSLAPEESGLTWRWKLPLQALDAPLAPILHDAAQLLTSPAQQRIGQCDGHHCSWLFLDTSKNRSRRWCDMKVCGNRAKVRRFREKKEG